MKLIHGSLILSGLLALLMSGPSFAESVSGDVKGVFEDFKTKAFEVTDKDTKAITFDKGSAKLSENDVSSIRALIRSARNSGKIDRVFVAAWSDKPYPVDNKAKLKDADERLATKRTDAIASVLRNMDVGNIDEYNMAKGPNWVQNLFNTDAAELNAAMKNKSVDDQKVAKLGQYLKREGGASKAVVVVQRDGSISH
jgi:hypothetical protein